MTRSVSPLTADQRAAFLAAARSFRGARWRHQARLPRCMDCLGLIALSFHAIGVPVTDRKGYGRDPYNRQLDTSLREHFGAPVVVGPEQWRLLQPGDIVTLQWTGEARHVAIVSDHPEGLGLIHSWANAPGAPGGGGAVVEHRLSPDWARRIVEGYRP